MKENKDQPGRVSTCFDGSPCAEMMEKIMGEQGIGSLCEEMMQKVIREQGKGSSREEIMKALMKDCCEGQAEPQESKKGGLR